MAAARPVSVSPFTYVSIADPSGGKAVHAYVSNSSIADYYSFVIGGGFQPDRLPAALAGLPRTASRSRWSSADQARAISAVIEQQAPARHYSSHP